MAGMMNPKKGIVNWNGDAKRGDLSIPKAFNRAVSFALGKIKVEEKIFVIFDLVK